MKTYQSVLSSEPLLIVVAMWPLGTMAVLMVVMAIHVV